MRQLPDFIKKIWRTLVWRLNPDEKVIFLTFDDGPTPQVTPKTLDWLDEFGAKATFFCVGENVSKHPELFEEIKRRGHAVGNHTHNHLKGFRVAAKDYVENARKADKWIHSRLFRPPHGQITPKQIRVLKDDFKIVMWDFITYDYNKDVESETIIKEVKKRSRNGSIVVFHDSPKAEKNMLQALPEALKFWQEEGYEIRGMTEC